MAVSELPGNPNAVWTVKKNVDGKKSQKYFMGDGACVCETLLHLKLFTDGK